MRINKYLAQAGIASRRKSEEYILSGRVKVNNKIVTDLAFKINPANDKVLLDDKIILLIEKNIYILLNKPKGYVCSLYDPYNKQLARSLIPLKDRIFNVGRLDKNTEGLIIYTNDGQLANRLTHPNFKIKKTYLVKINKPILDEDIEKIRKGGIKLDTDSTLPAFLNIKDKQKTIIELTIMEGKKRQIRRVFKNLNYNVLNLDRIAIGNIANNGLEIGNYRYLSEKEIKGLK